MNLISLSIAILIIYLVQHPFNKLVERDLSLSYLFSQSITGFDIKLVGIAGLLTGILISGLYPAFVTLFF